MISKRAGSREVAASNTERKISCSSTQENVPGYRKRLVGNSVREEKDMTERSESIRGSMQEELEHAISSY